MARWVELLTVLTLAFGLLGGILGLGTRYVLLPFLRDHLIAPVLERLDALTHRLDTVAHQNREHASKLEDLAEGQSTAARVFENHIAWAERHKLPRRWR